MKGKNKLKKRKKKDKVQKEEGDTFRVIGFTRNLIIFDKV